MSKANKKEIKAFLSSLDKNPRLAFNQVSQKLRELKINPRFVNALNAQGFSEERLKSAKSELANYFGINHRELKLLNSSMTKANKKAKVIKLEEKTTGELTPIEPTTPSGNLTEEEQKQKVIDSAKDDENLKLREEFPFLNEPDCPEEFFVLIGKKLTAYHNCKNLREFLANNPDLKNDELTIINKEINENFQLNEKYYKELKHYQEHKEILGEVSLFEELKIKQSVEEMPTAELHKRAKNLATYISKNKHKIENQPQDKKVEEWKHRKQMFEYELRLVNGRLGVQDTRSKEEE